MQTTIVFIGGHKVITEKKMEDTIVYEPGFYYGLPVSV